MNRVAEKQISFFTFDEVGGILGARSEGAPEFRHTPINDIKIDSRIIRKGDLFVAIKGDNDDGHKYVSSAFDKGAVGAIVLRERIKDFSAYKDMIIPVGDTVYALGELAKNHRKKISARVIAVTGSNGKTTVKNIIYELVTETGPSIKSQGNYNNLYGLPLSIFQLKNNHQYAVFELGMSEKGEISRLGEIAKPDVGIITNVGPVHLEFFSGVKEIAQAKMEILEHISPAGALVVNGDEELLESAGRGYEYDTIRFGFTSDNNIYPMDLEFNGTQQSRFKIDGIEFNLNMPGVHNVYNALASFAVSRVLGLDPHRSAEIISSYRPSEMRSEIIKKGGITFYIDCYNANPISMKYALDTISKMKCSGKRIAVLGDMLELGKDSRLLHEQIGNHAKESNIDLLLALGEQSIVMVEAFGKGGEWFSEKAELIDKIGGIVKKDDLVLFKASRGMALEEVAEKVMGNL